VVVGRNQESIGLTKTLNLLIRATRAPLVARVDSGDTCAPNRLERQRRYLEENPGVAAACSTVELFIPPDTRVGPLFEPFGTELSAAQLRYKNPVVHGSVMLRREVFDALGPYNENCRFAQDLDLWLRILTSGRRMHWIKEPLYFLEVVPEGISVENADAQAKISDRIRDGFFKANEPSRRRMSLWRMQGLARLRRLGFLGRSFRVAESLLYELRCRVS
jgi:hypothetical protein